MGASFFDHVSDVEDPRATDMIFCRLDEILLTELAGLLRRAEDCDEIEDMAVEPLDWLKRTLPVKNGIAPAQTLKRTLAQLDPRQFGTASAASGKSLAGRIRGVVIIDGETVRGSGSR